MLFSRSPGPKHPPDCSETQWNTPGRSHKPSGPISRISIFRPKSCVLHFWRYWLDHFPGRAATLTGAESDFHRWCMESTNDFTELVVGSALQLLKQHSEISSGVEISSALIQGWYDFWLLIVKRLRRENDITDFNDDQQC